MLEVYLLWQTIKDGRKQLRRFCPQRPTDFLGYESQTQSSLKWIKEAGNPQWPDDRHSLNEKVPFQVFQEVEDAGT